MWPHNSERKMKIPISSIKLQNLNWSTYCRLENNILSFLQSFTESLSVIAEIGIFLFSTINSHSTVSNADHCILTEWAVYVFHKSFGLFILKLSNFRGFELFWANLLLFVMLSTFNQPRSHLGKFGRLTQSLSRKFLSQTRQKIYLSFPPQILKLYFLMGHPWPSFRSFLVFFKQTIQISQQINVKKCSSSIHCQDSNSRPSDYESPPLTTRPDNSRP